MTKKEKMKELKELRRYYHIARVLKDKGGKNSALCEGMMIAYHDAMELLLTPAEKEKFNLYEFIWADTSTEY